MLLHDLSAIDEKQPGFVSTIELIVSVFMFSRITVRVLWDPLCRIQWHLAVRLRMAKDWIPLISFALIVVAAKRLQLQNTLSSQCLVCLFRAAVETCWMLCKDRIIQFSGIENMIPTFRWLYTKESVFPEFLYTRAFCHSLLSLSNKNAWSVFGE